ncbi:MAG TPA: type II toxin-antitoxin system prevent-host-death family antitoxin [Burkholderiales bacterium]|nr:type II toxin-antitoxin system prevent-host-death family antitoxin [Burkholderiales bacterium]
MYPKKTIFNIAEAKAHFSTLLERVQRGETIVIAKAGTPCARLVPPERAPRKPGALKGKIKPTKAFFEPLPDEELRLWEGQ